MKRWIAITIWSVLAVAVLGFIIWRAQAGIGKAPVKTVTASRQSVVKDISFTGSAEPVQSADISFEVSGAIKSVSVQVGDTVKKGQVLASLDPESPSLQVAKAQADKASAASLAYTAWQNALQTQKNTNAENAKLIDAKKQSVRDAKAVLDASTNIYTQKQSETQTDDSATLTTYATVVANKAVYNAAQTALTSALKTVKTSNDAVKHSADYAYAQYISTQQAAQDATGLSSLDALAKLAQATAAKSILRAPIAGIVIRKNSGIGEFAAAGSPVITIAQTSDLQLSADVPETDALALANDMQATVTFDALPDAPDTQATVSQVYPAATAIQGVPTFHVVLQLASPNEAIRAGITANVTVHAQRKDNVIAVPRRTIATKGDKHYVQKQTGPDQYTETEVQTGLIGSDGLEEVTSGLQDGDVVISP